ncbi:MAG: acyl-CoA dehydrogenase family protein, partial [Chloroflexi bacterium]|nr:acyl-CoA dehydrogenase family protein [Chloroflexota bacterium]
KKTFLPKIGNNEFDIAQGFSEPNAGTDLANLQTRAVEDGDDFVVTGQKIWSSGSHFADWYHVMVRTDPNAPKHRGISYLMMQLKDEKGNQMPGITLRPLYDFFGRRRWNEVFMDEVRVPKRHLIGELNRGWYTAMTTLNFERTGIETPARSLGILERFIDFCRERRFNSTPILDDPLVRHKLADLRVQIETDRLLCLRVASAQAKGQPGEREGLVSGYRSMLFVKLAFWPTLAHIIQDYWVLLHGDPRAPHGGLYGTNYAISLATGFGGGGGILLSPGRIAQRSLGLPR